MVGEKMMNIRDVQELELSPASWFLGGRNTIETPGFLAWATRRLVVSFIKEER